MIHEYVPEPVVEWLSNNPLVVLATLVSFAATYALFYEGLLYGLGRPGRFWRTLRSVLPYVDDEARQNGFYTSYEIDDDELVGVYHVESVEELRLNIEEYGFMLNPLAAHKEYRGKDEVLSVGYYGVDGQIIRSMPKWKRFLTMLLLPRQLHVMAFEHSEGPGYLLTAHSEFSPYNPFVAFWHLVGKGLDVEKGVEQTRWMLSGDPRFEPVDEYEQAVVV